MRIDIDIEELLARYRNAPEPRVKHSVMAFFKDSYDTKGAGKSRVLFWKRVLPVYAAAAIMIITAALSFFAGWRLPRDRGTVSGVNAPIQQTEISADYELQWEFTENDIL